MTRRRDSVCRINGGVRKLFSSVVFLLLVVWCTLSGARAANFKVGVSLPFTSVGDALSITNIKNVLSLALTEANSLDSGSTDAAAVSSTFQAEGNSSVALIGGYTSDSTLPMALAANPFQLWQCSGSATTPSLSDKVSYPYFYRTIPSDNLQGSILANFCLKMNWTSVSVLFGSDTYGFNIAQTFVNVAQTLNITVATSQSFTVGSTQSSAFTPQLTAIALANSRVVLFLGVYQDFVTMARFARAANMIGNGWVWLGSDGLATMSNALAANSANATDIDNTNGVLYAFPVSQGARWTALAPTYNTAFPNQALSPYSLFYYDCLVSIAHGITKLQSQSYVNITLTNFLDTFEGETGSVAFDPTTYERNIDYVINNIYNLNEATVYRVNPQGVLTSLAVPTFYSGSHVIPSALPTQTLGYPNWSDGGSVAVAVLSIITAVAMMVVLAYLYTQRNTYAIKTLDFGYLTTVSVGLIMIVISSVLRVGLPNTAMCVLYIWLNSFGTQMALAACLMRVYKIWRIFDNQLMDGSKELNKQAMIKGGVLCLSFVFLLLVIWCAWSAPVPSLTTTPTKIYWECKSPNSNADTVLPALLVLYSILTLLAIIYLGFSTRTLPTPYAESPFLMYSAQNMILCIVIVTPFIFYGNQDFYIGEYILRGLASLYASAFAFSCIVGRAAYLALRKVKAKSKAGESGALKKSAEVLSRGKPLAGAGKVMEASSRQALTAKLPVKKGNTIFSTWHFHTVAVFGAEGYFGLMRSGDKPEERGRLYPLHTVVVESDVPGLPLCLRLKAGQAVYLVQLFSSEEHQKWHDAFATAIKATLQRGPPNDDAAIAKAADEAGSQTGSTNLAPVLPIKAAASTTDSQTGSQA
ncbi:hypothetical protein RI367_007619 [Sorochytrium milnesiophthora]